MGETTEGITVNDDPETVSLREWIAKHADHLDTGIHELRQAVGRLEKMITDIHEEMEAARPLIERWQHSKIRQLVAGRLPWQE